MVHHLKGSRSCELPRVLLVYRSFYLLTKMTGSRWLDIKGIDERDRTLVSCLPFSLGCERWRQGVASTSPYAPVPRFELVS